MAERWLPVAIRLWSHDKLVLRVVLDTKAELANCDLRAHNALIFAFVNQLALAARTLEATRLCLRKAGIPFECAIDELIDSTWLNLLLSLFLTPLQRILFENIDTCGAPIRSTEWAVEGLPTALIVLEAAHQAISVDLSTTPITAVREVLVFPYRIAANTTGLFGLEGPRWHNWPFILALLSATITAANPDATAANPNTCAALAARVCVTHDVRRWITVKLRIKIVALILAQLCHCASILVFYPTILHLIIHGVTIAQQLLVSLFKDFIQL